MLDLVVTTFWLLAILGAAVFVAAVAGAPGLTAFGAVLYGIRRILTAFTPTKTAPSAAQDSTPASHLAASEVHR
jgi:hypothetical protein